ncbi:acylneuraminate cytidylyltransferase family protein [Vibrio vulnificus]|uniref:acylneuraminate cytidylyltransferase family protein n=1 Tax=Vibrio vulnificus TaxID=672 RepID=UPI0002EE30AE|nr:acylneuraminate cytidylyltransferase family protein [Vibrio vulnificus]EGQ7952129.1 acylneuraminate cytidylyltransferase family protein [Vibrio vulnificus]EGQ7983858.1 acylneuraminate cytidylyltransferase family protein [Vibrio vulnificus]EGQ9292142.1 acylneuraminate cytidylyltransferase family protein [Vibrio vulnificus]EGQ9991153.1 acylneuraminate cytidylyltransferase family protein [Vibrio vulnificus]EGR0753045.1 acylneuraminate cytidylyltransferase family protein [Vibrio vulnificus]
MKNFAFIFVRGGSKGLPRKNIKLLAGKPLLQYSVDTALAAPSINQVFVSTEDAEIADVARRSGAVVIDRPTDLASDTSPEWLSWRHAIEWVQEHYGAFDGFVSLPATSPLRSVDDVEAAMRKRIEAKADICISVTPASRSPYFNMVKHTDAGFVELVNKPQGEVVRRQDAPEVFDITTVVYVTTPEFVLNNYGIFTGKVTSIEVPKERAVDIDDIYDFKLAEAIVQEQC